MIREIKQYIKERKVVSLSDLENYTRMEEQALMPILKKLEDKKTIRIEKPDCSLGCSGCECSNNNIEIIYLDS